MSINKKAISLLGVFILIVLVSYHIVKPTYHGPINLENPIQNNIKVKEITIFDKKGNPVNISLFAEYKVYAGVKGVEKYWSDSASIVAPVDFILAWGNLNDVTLDKVIRYSQSKRWYFYKYSIDAPVDGEYISQHSANTHIIPKDDQILKKIKKIRKSDYILLEGYLATVHFESGDWSSSNNRQDTGNGSCEILYVTNVEIY